MNYHSEFEIEANADEVIRTGYWTDQYFSVCESDTNKEKLKEIDQSYCTKENDGEMTVREHIPMDKQLWKALSEEIEYLKEHLEPVERKAVLKPPAGMIVLDGGDYTRLYLTWDIDGAEKTVQYHSPSGKRWTTVIAILHEMVRPLGRELHRIGKTEMTDLFLKAPDYSYQITPIRDSSDYYFFVHGDKSDINRICAQQWQPVRVYLSDLDISDFKTGKYESKYYLRLNYNDGISKNLEINKKIAEQIRRFIRKSILDE